MLRWDGMSCENCNSFNVMYDRNRTRGNPLVPKTHFTCRDCGVKFWAVAHPDVVQPGLGLSRRGSFRNVYWYPEARDGLHHSWSATGGSPR